MYDYIMQEKSRDLHAIAKQHKAFTNKAKNTRSRLEKPKWYVLVSSTHDHTL